jgi:hypothetical protein
MGQAIGASLPLAIGIAISPIPIIAVVLMLTTSRAKTNGPAFLLGWLLGLGIVGAIVLAIAGPAGASQSGAPATWAITTQSSCPFFASSSARSSSATRSAG